MKWQRGLFSRTFFLQNRLLLCGNIEQLQKEIHVEELRVIGFNCMPLSKHVYARESHCSYRLVVEFGCPCEHHKSVKEISVLYGFGCLVQNMLSQIGDFHFFSVCSICEGHGFGQDFAYVSIDPVKSHISFTEIYLKFVVERIDGVLVIVREIDVGPESCLVYAHHRIHPFSLQNIEHATPNLGLIQVVLNNEGE